VYEKQENHKTSNHDIEALSIETTQDHPPTKNNKKPTS